MNEIYDILIIGAGPAALNAALYGTRGGFRLAVIERLSVSGGQVNYTYEVDNYLGIPEINGMELARRFREHCDRLGVEFIEDEIISIEEGAGEGSRKSFRLISEDCEYAAKAVIIATGATSRKLGIPGEEELAGLGVSYCATCDGAFFRRRETAVVGGGNTAAEDALFLARGCSHVYLLHRRDELRASKVLCDALQANEKITIMYSTVPEAIEGEDSVTGLKYKNVKDGSTSVLGVSGVFVAVGTDPNSGICACENGISVGRDDAGYIIAGEDCCTDVPGIFAAGDVRTKQLRQVITAAADGANAISSAERYLGV